MNIDIIKHILEENIEDKDTIPMIISKIKKEIREKETKPWIIKKGEHFYNAYYAMDSDSIATYYGCNEYDVAKRLNSDFGIVAPTHYEVVELYNARKMQWGYEQWCMEYPVDWGNEEQYKWFVLYDCFTNEIIITYNTEYCKGQGVIYCANEEHIRAFIDKVGKQNFIKYVIGIGLPKYFLEV